MDEEDSRKMEAGPDVAEELENTIIDLEGNDITTWIIDIPFEESSHDLWMAYMDELIQAAEQNTSVECVNLGMEDFYDITEKSFCEKLGFAVSRLQNLAILDLELEVFEFLDPSLIVRHLKQLRVLSIFHAHRYSPHSIMWCYGNSLAAMLANLQSLESFEMSEFISGDLTEVFSALATLPKLRQVELIHDKADWQVRDITEVTFLGDLLMSPSLESVSLGNFKFQMEHSREIAFALSSNHCCAIQHLKLYDCEFDLAGFRKIIRALFENRTVRELDISLQLFFGAQLVELATLISVNTTLKTLKLKGIELNRIHVLTAQQSDVVTRLVYASLLSPYDMPIKNQALNTYLLPFVGSEEGVPGSVAFLWALGRNTTLETIRLDDVEGMTEVDIIMLVFAMKDNPVLKSVEISSNGRFDISIEASEILLAAVRQNYILEKLEFQCIGSNTESLDDIVEGGFAELLVQETRLCRRHWKQVKAQIDCILRLNKAGRRYVLEDRSNRSKLFEMLSQVSNDTNCVYMHLRENPSFFEDHANAKKRKARDLV